jgi:hypothetical protein
LNGASAAGNRARRHHPLRTPEDGFVSPHGRDATHRRAPFRQQCRLLCMTAPVSARQDLRGMRSTSWRQAMQAAQPLFAGRSGFAARSGRADRRARDRSQGPC